MKKILLFYLEDCGYCARAHRAMVELMEENPAYKALDIEQIEESQHMDIAEKYDYYATPTFYVGGEKAFEAHIGMSYEDIKKEVKRVFDLALNG